MVTIKSGDDGEKPDTDKGPLPTYERSFTQVGSPFSTNNDLLEETLPSEEHVRLDGDLREADEQGT